MSDSGDYTYPPVQVIDRVAHLEAQVKELIAWQALMMRSQSFGISPLTETCANGAQCTSLEVAHTLKIPVLSPNGSKESDTIASVAIGKSQRQQQRQRQPVIRAPVPGRRADDCVSLSGGGRIKVDPAHGAPRGLDVDSRRIPLGGGTRIKMAPRFRWSRK